MEEPGASPVAASSETSAGSGTAFGPGMILATGAWFGAIVSLLELVLVFVVKWTRDTSPGFFRMNRHIAWMIPLDDMIVFGTLAVALALVALAMPRMASRVAPVVFGALGFLTLLLTYRRLLVWACVLVACGLGLRLGSRIGRNADRWRRIVRYSLPAFGLALMAIAGSSYYGEVLTKKGHVSPARAGAPKPPNVLLVVLDTVRADRLSAYGYGRETTPNLARRAGEGVRFDWARSAAPWTLPSHASLLTGRWPHELSAGFHGPLDDAFPTLAEFLSSKGYDAAGLVGNENYTGAETGLSRGFHHYDDHDLSYEGILRASTLGERVGWEAYSRIRAYQGRPTEFYRGKHAEQITDRMLGWLERRPDPARPFFAFLNYFDVHNPYEPPRSYSRRFGVGPKSASDYRVIWQWFILNKKTLTPNEVQLASDGYDDCLAYLDQHLGRLFDELESRGVLKDTVVVVTADHGEHFGEHGLYGHASSLYDQEVHVPLLVFGPAAVPRGKVVETPISTRNVAATIVDLAGFSADSPFPGRSLARHWGESAALADDEPESILSEVDEPAQAAPNQGRSPVFRGAMKTLVSGNEVYVRNGDGVEELYNVSSDPNQFRDLSKDPAFRPRLDRFRSDLQELLREDPAGKR